MTIRKEGETQMKPSWEMGFRGWSPSDSKLPQIQEQIRLNHMASWQQ